MPKFAFPVVRDQSQVDQWGSGKGFKPFRTLLNNSVGCACDGQVEHDETRMRDTSVPKKVDDGPFLCLVE